MGSLRRHEGYLMVDHRASMGVPDEVVMGAGMPVGAGRGMFEAPTYTCSHCQAVVIINPKRNRERPFCMGCNHHICDGCGARQAADRGKCRTMKQIMDEIQEAAARGLDTSTIAVK